MFELTQRLCFNLTDTFTGNRKLLTNLFKSMISIHADTKAHTQYAFFTWRKRGENTGGCITKICLNSRINRQQRILIFDEIAQMGIFLVAHRGFERDWLLGDFENLT